MAAETRVVRILCVDDEVPLLELTRRLLSKLGCEVTTHADPREALVEFRTRPAAFDLLITDISMPGMSGFSLIGEVRKVRPDLPAVVTSGCVSSQDTDHAGRLGNTQVIQKTSTIDDYLRVLTPLLARKPE